MAERNRNFKNDALSNDTLSDVEKFLFLLSDLKIIDAENSARVTNTNSLVEDLDEPDDLDDPDEPISSGTSIESSELSRSPAPYSFPSLLDELPFLQNIPPVVAKRLDEHQPDHQPNEKKKEQPKSPKKQNLAFSNEVVNSLDRANLPIIEAKEVKVKEETDTINLIQSLFLGIEETPSPTKSPTKSQSSDRSSYQPKPSIHFQPKLEDVDISEKSTRDEDDNNALHLLQDILVVPELEDLRSFKISVEQKLGLVESQVNSPVMMNKLKELESLVQNASLDLSNFGSKLTAIGSEQENIPTEVAKVRDRVAQLEHRLYEPNELVQLLLPIVAELLSLKVTESREAMCQAIMPIIAEVIFERSQMDQVAMSHAFSQILPNAITERIRNNPQDIALAIAPEIASAIREQIRLDHDSIIDALAPEMGAAIKQQIVLERDAMVDALYPVIGNTIAKYFAEAINSINAKVEQTFSFEGLWRKLRAKIQGVSEAELIFKESTPFDIQAIFLIHNLSGLVMIDIQKSDLDALVEPIDSDMLAGMLTAIRSFANECMSRSSSNAELDAINYSGSKILLEVAGYCYLAVIIRGEPDRSLVTKIRDVFGRIVQIYGDRIKEFDGDPSMIPPEVEIDLKTLMKIVQTKTVKKSSRTVVLIGLGVLALILIPIGIFQYQANRNRQVEAKVLEGFASTPELSVYRLNVAANGDSLQLSGKLPNQSLRDRALQVANEAAQTEFKEGTAKINNQIYAVNVPPDPELVAAEVQRLTKVMNYTAGANISSTFSNGVVTIRGQIEQPSMIPTITQTYAKISGVQSVTNSTNIRIPKLLTRIYFPFAVTALQPTDVEKLVEVQTFLEMYPDYNIKILTKNDDFGDRAINQNLGKKRAEAVYNTLLKRGVKANRLHISAIIEISAESDSNQMPRWVEFQPTLKPAP